MQTTKPAGSFGIPKDMQDEINRTRNKKDASEQPAQTGPSSDVEDIVNDKPLPTGTNEDVKEVNEKEQIKEVLAEIRKGLGVDLNEDDIWSFLYSNEIKKRNIVIIPGKMHATFRTISLDDTNEIDSAMATELDAKRLENGFKNINTQHILSRGLVELGKPGKVRSLGETSKIRYEAVGKMSALLVEKLGKKWNEFTFLVDQTIKEEMESKKD